MGCFSGSKTDVAPYAIAAKLFLDELERGHVIRAKADPDKGVEAKATPGLDVGPKRTLRIQKAVEPRPESVSACYGV